MMNTMTLAQLRAASTAGGVRDVTLKGQGGGFLIEIATQSGQDMFLAKARSTEPRRFGNPARALALLQTVGIERAHTDTTDWVPDAKDESKSRTKRSAALRSAHQAVAYGRWLQTELQASVDDPQANISHDEAMHLMDDEIAAQATEKNGRA